MLDRALLNQVLTKSEHQFLYSKHPVVPHFYHIPKVHKDMEKPPGRPIIAGIDSLTSNLGSYIDHFLQGLVTSLPSYIKDSGHALEILTVYAWEKGYRWLSFDVASLYTSIQREFGLRAIEYYLAEAYLFKSVQAQFIYECIEFTLTHNYFLFMHSFYRQVKGTAMGSRFAPSYSNLFMGYWELKYI